MADVQPTPARSEIWKPVVGHEGHYEVSDLGNVRSLDRRIITKSGVKKRRKGQQLKLSSAKNGYLTIGIQGTKFVHRIVLEAFVGAAPEGTETCHRNGIRVDNRLENLYWGTSSDNNNDIVRHGHHWQVKKDHCPRGHALGGANIAPSQAKKNPGGNSRECLSCSRARSIIRNNPELGSDMQELSDEKYAELQSDLEQGRTSRANKAKTHCKRGHLLELPNLREKLYREKGYRNCKACGTAAVALRARGVKSEARLQELSDEKYRTIISRFA